MKYKTRENIFNKIMVAMRSTLYSLLKLDRHAKYKSFRSNDGLVPILFVNPKNNFYRFGCYCFECPANRDGICATQWSELLDSYKMNLIHEFDGDNIIKNYCG